MTDLYSILVGSTDLEGHPATSIRYTSNVVETNGQTWFRWQYSAVLDEFYDVMYFDETDAHELRYYQTVTPTEVVTYNETISYGPAIPGTILAAAAFEAPGKSSPKRRFRRMTRKLPDLESTKGTSTVDIVPSVGDPSSGTVDYETITTRAGDNIELVSRHTVVIDSGPAVVNSDYAEHWVFDALGPVRTMGPGWAVHRV